MRNRKLFTPIIAMALAATLLSASAQTGDAKPKVEDAKDADIEQAIWAARGAIESGGTSSSSRSSALRYLTQIERYLAQKNYNSARSQVDSMFSYANTEEMRTAFRGLAKTMDALQKVEQEKIKQRGKALIAGIPAACLAAEDEADLEELAEALAECYTDLSRFSSSSSSPSLNTMRTKIQNAQNLVRDWTHIVVACGVNNHAQALQKITGIIGNAYYVQIFGMKPLVQKQEALNLALSKELEGEMAEVRKILGKADTMAGVQSAKSKLDLLYQKVSSAYNHPMRQTLDLSRQALQYWMNVVAAEEQGNVQAALQALRSLESGTYRSTAILPWETVAARKKALITRLMEGDATTSDPMLALADEQVKAAKDIDALLALGPRLQALISTGYSSGSGYQEIQHLVSDLQTLGAANNALQNRQFAQIFQYSASVGNYRHRWKTVTARHYRDIRRDALEVLCEIDDLSPMEEGQTEDETLLALADAAVAKREWARAHRLLDGYRMAFFAHQRPAWLDAELAGCASFIAGRNFEKAGQYERAVSAYLGVLNLVGTRLPIEEAGERLKALKEEHPEAFEGVKPATSASKPAAGPMPTPIPSALPQPIPIHPQHYFVNGVHGMR